MEKINKKILKKDKIQNLMVLFFFVAFICIVFRRYLFGEYYYFIMDDSFNQLYPNMYQFAEEVWSGTFSLWNFNIGIGTEYTTFYTDPFNWLSIIFGVNHVAKGIVFSECVKIFLVLLSAYLYACNFCKNKISAVIFSVFVASSGTTLVLGMYTSYTKITLCIMLAVAIFEKILKNKKWLYLSIPIIITEILLGYYYLVLVIGMLFLYTVGRCFMEGYKLRESAKCFFKVFFAVAIGVVIVSPMLWNNLKLLLESDRLNKAVDTSNISLGWIADKKIIKSAVLRTLSPDIEGTAENYTGALRNYMDGPGFYIGNLLLLLIPQEIYMSKGRKKILFIICIFLSVIYVCCPKLTYFINGNSNYTFKMSGMLVCFVLLFIALNGLCDICEQKKENNTILFITYLVIQGLIIGIYLKKMITNYKLLVLISVLLVVETIMLILTKKNVKCIMGLLIIGVLEILICTNEGVNPENAITNKQFEETYYNDGTKKVVDYIKENDNELFYRIEKNYKSVGYCDALAQNYYGIKSYIGGNNVSNDYATYLNVLGMPLSNNDSRWIIGFYGYPQMNSLFDVKYMITNWSQYGEYGFELTGQCGDKYIFKNKYAIPLGSVYTKCLSYENFEQLPNFNERRNALLEYCIANEEVGLVTDYSKQENVFQEKNKSIQIDKKNGIVNFDYTEENQTIVLEIDIDCESRVDNQELIEEELRGKLKSGSIGTINFVNTGMGICLESRQVSVQDGKMKYTFECSLANVNEIQIVMQEKKLVTINNISCKIVNSDSYYENYRNLCAERQQNGYVIEKFYEDYIEGYIDIDEDGILVMSVPYDSKWECYVDGKSVEVKKINYCFCGVEVTRGKHTVKFKYNWF